MNTLQAVGRAFVVCFAFAFAAGAAATGTGLPAVGDSIAISADGAGAAPAHEKSYTFGGALTLVPPLGYTIMQSSGTVNLTTSRLQNDSYSNTSGTIRLRLILTTAPISGPFSYWIVGEYALSPLAPRFGYDNIDVTVPLLSVPDGIYYVYLGAFEFENNCGSSSGYCVDDLASFTKQIQVSGGVYSFYTSGMGATATAVEYYWSARDHYFFSTNPAEIAALDASPPGGWVRTGYTFGAYATPVAGSSPVCRFYIPPLYGDSHFYSASPAECAAVRTAFPVLVYEAPNVTNLILPNLTTGACPAGSDPVYRLYNNRSDTNHRYTTSLAIRSLMLSRGYTPEGYGPNGVAACAPI